MSIYSVYDIYNNEITLTSDNFDTLLYKDVLSTFDDVLNKGSVLNYDDIRTDKIYDYTILLKEFIDTRMEKYDILPLEHIERSGSINSVLMSDINDGVCWKKLVKPIESTMIIENILDEAIVLSSSNMVYSNFTLLENCDINNSSLIVGTNEKSIIKSISFKQDEGETEWSRVVPYISTFASVTDLVPEKCDIANNKICVITKALDMDLLSDVSDIVVLEKTGAFTNVVSIDSKEKIIQDNNILKSIAGSYKLVSYIKEDGQICMFGQSSVSDVQPPIITDGFRTLNGSYYGFVGVSKDNKLYGWGTYYFETLRKAMPTGNDYVDCDVGFNYGIALKEDGSLERFGTSSAYVTDAHMPGGNNWKKVCCGYKYAFALDNDGVLHGIGNCSTVDSFKFCLGFTTSLKVVDFECEHYSGIALLEDGTIKTWGTSISTFSIPSTYLATKKIKSLVGGAYVTGVITEDNQLVVWGYNSTLDNIGPKTTTTTSVYVVKDNVSYMNSYSYHGLLTSTEGVPSAFYRTTTSDPDISVKTAFLGLSPLYSSAIGGIFYYGTEYMLTLKDHISITSDPFLLTDILSFSQTGVKESVYDYTDKTKKKNINIIIPGTYQTLVTIEFNEVTLFTKDISFCIENNNPYENLYKINLLLDKSKIGE